MINEEYAAHVQAEREAFEKLRAGMQQEACGTASEYAQSVNGMHVAGRKHATAAERLRGQYEYHTAQAQAAGRVLKILELHPEFEQFLQVLYSGLV